MMNWRPGDRVHHASFGDGTVLDANDQHITIHFDRAGRKKFAPHIVVLSESGTVDPASVRSGMARPVWPDHAHRADASRTHDAPGDTSRTPDGRGDQARTVDGRGVDPSFASPTAATRSDTTGMGPSSIEELVDLARQRVDSESSLNRFVSAMRGALASRGHQHEGTLSGMRVMQFQNWLLDENPRWQLTDAQLLAVMRVEFPFATGLVHTGDVDSL